MKILHLKNIGNTKNIVTNAVVIILKKSQISVVPQRYLPSYKVVLQCIEN